VLSKKTRSVTETGLLLALSLILYFLGFLFPGIGIYLRYLIPGLMAIITARHGYVTLVLYSIALAFCVGLFFGLEELIFALFMLIPAGFVLPLLYEDYSLKNKLIAASVFIISGFILISLLGLVMGVQGLGLVDKAGIWHYQIYGSFYDKMGVGEELFLATVSKLTWLIVILAGMLYGYMLYLINKVIYHRGLKVLEKGT